MKTQNMFKFQFNVNGRPYAFDEMGETREEALGTLLADMKMMLEEIVAEGV